VRAAAGTMMAQANPAHAVAGAVACAFGQPAKVDVGEVIVRPTAQQ
jgi:NADP-dependent 3-hydroxy acid dehydrogenase YdfG